MLWILCDYILHLKLIEVRQMPLILLKLIGHLCNYSSNNTDGNAKQLVIFYFLFKKRKGSGLQYDQKQINWRLISPTNLKTAHIWMHCPFSCNINMKNCCCGSRYVVKKPWRTDRKMSHLLQKYWDTLKKKIYSNHLGS